MSTSEKNDVCLCFYSLIDLGTSEKAREFYSILSDEGGIFIPERISSMKSKAIFNPVKIDEAINVWLCEGDHSTFINMKRRRSPRTSISIWWGRGPKVIFNYVSMWVDQLFIKKKGGVEVLLHLAERLFDYTGNFYGYVSRIDVEKFQHVPGTICERLPGVYWLNFFGPLYVDFFGKKKINESPCYHKKWIEGGVLLQTAPMPSGLEVSADREAENTLRKLLDNDAFPDLEKEKPPDVYTPGDIRAGLHLRPPVQHNTPAFDYSELRRGFETPLTPEQQKEDAINQFTKAGMKYRGEDETGSLVFTDRKGGRLLVEPGKAINYFHKSMSGS